MFQLGHYLQYRIAVVGLVNNDVLISNFKLYIRAFRGCINRKIQVSLKSPKQSEKLRIGILASFNGNSSLSSSILDSVPDDIDAICYDLEFKNKFADGSQRKWKHRKIRATIPQPSRFLRVFGDYFDVFSLADLITSDDLDILVVATGSIDLSLIKTVELSQAKTFVALNTGAMIFPHPKCVKQIQFDLPPGYSIHNGKLYSYRSKKIIAPEATFYDHYFPYDRRNILPNFNFNRNKVIFLNCRLSKLSSEYVASVARILKLYPNYKFVFMGREQAFLKNILKQFDAHGVGDRVKFEGEYSTLKDAKGEMSDPMWLKCVDYLRTSAIVLDTFPEDGGSSKVEAFCAYTPVVYLSSQPDQFKSPATYHILNGLRVPAAEAASITDYVSVAKRILSDDHYREKVCASQYNIAKRLTDPNEFWRVIRRCGQ